MQATTQVKILVPGDLPLVNLFGTRDELLKLVEQSFDASVLVRGNEITLSGEPHEVGLVSYLFEELMELIGRGYPLTADAVVRSIDMVKTGTVKPSEVFSDALLVSRTKSVRPKTVGQKQYVDAMRTNTIVFAIGPAGTGKTLLAMQYLREAVRRGERAAMFVFDEELGLLFARAKGMGFDLAGMREAGKLVIHQMDAAELSPGEFSHRVCGAVDREGIRVVAIDSLNGYQASMPEEQFLTLHLHELLQYLNRRGAATFLTLAQSGMVGEMKSPVDLTYLADNVIMLRYFEALGRVRRAMSVIKKRGGAHEDTIREFRIDGTGIHLGDALHEFQGVLRGVPTFVGRSEALMERS